MSSGSAALSPFTAVLFALGAAGSRKGFFDIFGIGKFWIAGSGLRGEGDVVRLRKGLFDGRLRDSPSPLLEEVWRSVFAEDKSQSRGLARI